MVTETQKMRIMPPPLSDESPWAQGFNDWLVFGDRADAFSAKMIGYEDYHQGKRDGRAWYKRHDIKSVEAATANASQRSTASDRG